MIIEKLIGLPRIYRIDNIDLLSNKFGGTTEKRFLCERAFTNLLLINTSCV